MLLSALTEMGFCMCWSYIAIDDIMGKHYIFCQLLHDNSALARFA